MKSKNSLIKEYGQFKIIKYEEQNKEYEGVLIETLDNKIIRCRLGKKTPTKPGYFVSFWEKDHLNKNRPYYDCDTPSETAIIINDGDQAGIFIIPKERAVKHGLLATEKQVGKMGMRFYPPWCDELNKTALATQQWQLNYFYKHY
ncbi:hypothetical protein GIY11_12270 [Aerococcaceae bacterium DSM 109653]|uniref:MepB protein n=1 Tax=Fundicoccus ignavus TaxID=2664442 RepID=A0A844BLH2_9LACT|nr:MepB family protein [Fundicoccus ignavus]MRI82775.1 hypothetical protein [Fundicoccus ignavus]